MGIKVRTTQDDDGPTDEQATFQARLRRIKQDLHFQAALRRHHPELPEGVDKRPCTVKPIFWEAHRAAPVGASSAGWMSDVGL